jgi:hypothetical protein
VNTRLLCSALSAALVGGVLASAPVMAQSQPDEAAPRLAGRSVAIVKSPTDVTEGDRYSVVVKVGSAAKAKKIELQVRTEDVLGNAVWQTAKSRRVAGKSKHELRLVADATNPLKMRALATYKDGRKVRSRAARVTTWRWFGLHQFTSYYYTPSTYMSDSIDLVIAGRAYVGWWGGGYQKTAWESRHTPGRNCTAMRGVVGVTDSSADGSAAEISIAADESTVVYRSPSLTPGAAYGFEVPLPRPYRIAIQARLTSTASAVPAIGAPQLLCDYDTGESPS